MFHLFSELEIMFHPEMTNVINYESDLRHEAKSRVNRNTPLVEGRNIAADNHGITVI